MKIIIGIVIGAVTFLVGVRLNETLFCLGGITIGAAIALVPTIKKIIGMVLGIVVFLTGIHLNDTLLCLGGITASAIIALTPTK